MVAWCGGWRSRQSSSGQEKPQTIARFSINAVPALAVLGRGMATDHASPDAGMATAAGPAEAIVPPTHDRSAAARQLRKTSPQELIS